MFRQSPRSRNARNKGLKIKHVLQISVLFGASIWLLYQVQHTDNKKPPVTTKVSENLHKDSSTDMIKLGRKGLRPRGKETNVQDKKESIDHETDEDDNETEAEELPVQGHEDEDVKQEEDGENASRVDGMGKNTKTEYEELKVEMKGHENEEAKEKEDGVKDEKKQNHDEDNGSKNEEVTIEVDGSKKSNMNIPSIENNKESAQESKNEDGNQMQPNSNEMVVISSPPDDQNVREENVSSEEVNDNNGEKGPSLDHESGSNPSHSQTNEEDKDSSSNTAIASEGETSTTGSTKFVKNRKIGNLTRKRMWIKSVKKNTSPDSYLGPKKTEVK